MMKQQAQLAVAAAFGVMSLGVLAHSASAQVPFPTRARSVSFWMARAMDQCAPSGLSVVGQPSLSTPGCLQSNTTTDNTLTMNFARVRITKRGRVALFASGFTFGDALRVRLQLRVTKHSQSVKHPPGVKTVTFVDQIVDCPKSPDAFVVRPNGSVATSTDLGACLAPNTNLSSGNIEIVSASLINVLNGKVVGVPGYVK